MAELNLGKVVGPIGPKGEKGDRGLQGIQGIQGPIGPKGEKGDSFKYEDFTQVQLEGLKGPKGDKGDTGPKGSTGEKGPQGIQGVTGEKGERGPEGPEGIQGPKGDKGDTGARGPQGIQGPKGDTGSLENLASTNIEQALGFLPKNYVAGDNISIVDDRISVTGQLGLTEEEVKKVKVDSAKDADTVGGHIVAKNVSADAVFTDTKTTINGKTGVIVKEDIVALGIPSKDTIVDISGKVDKVVGKGLSSNDYSDAEKSKLSGIEAGAQVNTVTSVAGKTGAVVVSKSDVGLSNVDNVKQMPISGGVLENYREKLITVHANNGNIDLSLGNVFQHTPSGGWNYSITNAASGQAHSFTLIINMGSTVRTLTFPASVKWQGEEIPDMSNDNKTYILTFMTVDGGSTWLGMFGGEF